MLKVSKMMMTMKTVGVLGILASLITKRQLDSLVIKCQHQPQIQFVNQVEMVRMMIMKMTMRLKTGSSEMVGSVPYYHVSGALSLPSEGKRWSGFGFKELFWFSLKTYKASNTK